MLISLLFKLFSQGLNASSKLLTPCKACIIAGIHPPYLSHFIEHFVCTFSTTTPCVSVPILLSFLVSPSGFPEKLLILIFKPSFSPFLLSELLLWDFSKTTLWPPLGLHFPSKLSWFPLFPSRFPTKPFWVILKLPLFSSESSEL
ncbi:unnamed protein product [Coffea canephora]|uniref:Uncharacterized protein n=1 Tax=Coffea canephora TaxID=49390 RepID=A0A068TUY3_COFCA|nr:unnamed protein product [Coffea canephora]